MKKRLVSETVKKTIDGDKLQRITVYENGGTPKELSYLVFVKQA